jgi:predicted phage terminase large subunit-like protein
MELNFKLHDKQMEVFNHPARFKVCAAGRRGGKSFLSAVMLLIKALQTEDDAGNDIKRAEVFYVAPTFNQGKDIMWNLLVELGGMAAQGGVIESVRQNEGVLRLVNGRTIKIKGSDRPDTLRGVGLSFVVMDEYADMKPEVWDLIVRPALSDHEGQALFIGTPDGKNHFYDLWCFAGEMSKNEHPEWESFHFNSMDNPKIKPKEIEAARNSMSAAAFRQEYEASFTAGGGGSFKEEYIKYADEPKEHGEIYVAVDLAGFGTGDGMIKSAVKKLDETAISIVEVSPSGWFVHEIQHGRWDVRETAMRIIKVAKDYQPVSLGIESGSLKNAVMPYLEDNMRRMSIYPHIEPLTHGGKKKTERITWALQGRFERGQITLKKSHWNRAFLDQLLDFPNPMAHDDLPDSLAYIDQVAQTNYNTNFEIEEYEPLDAWTGY